MEDARNVIDRYKGWSHEDIVADLDKSRLGLHVAIENLAHDFNIGTIVRNANAWNVAGVHIVGKRKYNRRGAMCTDKYLKMYHWNDLSGFLGFCKEEGLAVFAIDNVEGSAGLASVKFPKKCAFIYGGESDGVSEEGIAAAEKVVAIEQLGSTRSVNVGVASGVTMYEYVKQWRLRA
ncbi:TrmH family RNA methyltransferase [Candidatus Saccharibacteria bacterium]|nr:TrmH family RNA methyltransferase [Candidatus Saccharibacteria bacterium]